MQSGAVAVVLILLLLMFLLLLLSLLLCQPEAHKAGTGVSKIGNL